MHINIHVHVSRQGHNCQLSLLEKSLIILNHNSEKLLISTGFIHTFALKINIFCSASSFSVPFPFHCLFLLLLLFKKRSYGKDDVCCLVFLLGNNLRRSQLYHSHKCNIVRAPPCILFKALQRTCKLLFWKVKDIGEAVTII